MMTKILDDGGDDNDDDDDNDYGNNKDVPTCAEALLDLCPKFSDCSQMTRRSVCLCLGNTHIISGTRNWLSM